MTALLAAFLLAAVPAFAGDADGAMCLHWARQDCPTAHLAADGRLMCAATGKEIELTEECAGSRVGASDLRVDDLSPEGLDRYSRWRYATELVPKAVLMSMTAGMLRVFRNTFFAGHGRAFHDRALAAYFRGFSWYKPRADFRAADLSAIEKANVARAAAVEKELRAETKKDGRAPALWPFISADAAEFRPD